VNGKQHILHPPGRAVKKKPSFQAKLWRLESRNHSASRMSGGTSGANDCPGGVIMSVVSDSLSALQVGAKDPSMDRVHDLVPVAARGLGPGHDDRAGHRGDLVIGFQRSNRPGALKWRLSNGGPSMFTLKTAATGTVTTPTGAAAGPSLARMSSMKSVSE
jgi:hypothetical protein